MKLSSFPFTFYHAFIESVLWFCSVSWFGNLSLKNKNCLHQIVKWSSKLIGKSQLNPESLHAGQLQRMAGSILLDDFYSLHWEFQLLPSGRRYIISAYKTKLYSSIHQYDQQVMAIQQKSIISNTLYSLLIIYWSLHVIFLYLVFMVHLLLVFTCFNPVFIDWWYIFISIFPSCSNLPCLYWWFYFILFLLRFLSF